MAARGGQDAAGERALPFLSFVPSLTTEQRWWSGHETAGGDYAGARRHFADLERHLPKRVYPPAASADGRQRARFKAEEAFFKPRRSRRRAGLGQALADLAEQRYRPAGSSEPPPIALDGESARWRVTVERQFAERLFALRGCPMEHAARFEEVPARACERYSLGATAIRCATGGRRSWLAVRRASVLFADEQLRPRAKGDDYDAILGRLATCVQDDQSAAFADLLIDLAHGVPLDDDDNDALMKRYDLDIDATLMPYAMDLFRRAYFYLCVKEPAGWLSAAYNSRADSEKYKAGLSVSLARAVLLLRGEHISLSEFLSPGGGFNPYAVKRMADNWADVLDVCADIDEKYKRAYRVKLNTEQAHRDLVTVFGGDRDSDGEEYADEQEKEQAKAGGGNGRSSSLCDDDESDDDDDDDDAFLDDSDEFRKASSSSSDYESDFVDDAESTDILSSSDEEEKQKGLRRELQRLGKSVRPR